MSRPWLSRLLFLLVGLIALAVAIVLHPRAFPTANVAIALDRPAAERKLSALIESLGHSIEGYRSDASFAEDTTPRNFIDRQYGSQRLEQADRDGVNLWYWQTRRYKPEQHEEFSAACNPSGDLVCFDHTIDEETPKPDTGSAAARAAAEAFLKTHVPHHPSAQLRFVEESSVKRSHRTDYSFTWERADLRIGDAPYRLWVSTFGTEIGYYYEGLKVPEAWQHEFRKGRSLNTLYSALAGYANTALLLGATIVFIQCLRRGNLQWRRAMPWGWIAALIAAAAGVAINQFESTLGGYDTSQAWAPFFFQTVLESILSSTVGTLASFLLLFVLADRLYRDAFPQHLPFAQAMGKRALRHPHTVRALGVGIVCALVSLAYVSLFYVVGAHWGVWCPIHVDTAKILSGPIPWIEPFNTGLSAAFNEEMMYRVIGLVLIWRVVKLRWLAVIFSAALWAFLHSNYPQMPGYIRGLELTLGGILWTVVLLRYGIVATLTTHYLYNCWLGSVVLFQSPSLATQIGAGVASLWPVALFLWGAWSVSRAPLSESDEPRLPATSISTAPQLQPQPLPPVAPPSDLIPHFSARQRWQIAGVSAAAIGLTLLLRALTPESEMPLASLGKLELSQEAIATRADALLRERGFAPETYTRVLSKNTAAYDFSATDYLLEQGSSADYVALATKEWSDLNWRARYFRPLEKEEISLYLDKKGNFRNWQHTLPREAPGASLERDAALALAKKVLAWDHGVQWEHETLVTDSLTQQEHRRDWYFAWERTPFPWGEAKLRTTISVQGNEVSGFRKALIAPEAWEREQEKSGWKELIQQYGSMAGIILFTAILVTILFSMIGRGEIPWRLSFKLALLSLPLVLILTANQLPSFYANYTTTLPLLTYWTLGIGKRLMQIGGFYLVFSIGIGITLGLLRRGLGWELPQLVIWPTERETRAAFWQSTLFAVVAGIALSVFPFTLTSAVGQWIVPSPSLEITSPDVSAAIPWLGELTNALLQGIGATLMIGAIAGLVQLLRREYPRLGIPFLVSLPLISLNEVDSLREAAVSLGEWIILGVIVVWLCRKVWRFNAVAIFLCATLETLSQTILLYLKKGGPHYEAQATPLILLLLATPLALLWAHRRGAPTEPFEPETVSTPVPNPDDMAAHP